MDKRRKYLWLSPLICWFQSCIKRTTRCLADPIRLNCWLTTVVTSAWPCKFAGGMADDFENLLRSVRMTDDPVVAILRASEHAAL